MSKQKNSIVAITANRLTDGVVIYLTADGGWTEKVEEATVAEDASARQGLEAKAQAGLAGQHITHWEPVEVERRDGILTAVKNKEAIKSRGPTVRRDLGKQAELYA
ncbi:DUF2849 domain-containing protein [Hwanghaeella sp.]|uniref:DUF2849 domain-containing protein n=1 Tax=Hwanghaeella sp. TaxID=2605943 RepID=UPI003CCB8A93